MSGGWRDRVGHSKPQQDMLLGTVRLGDSASSPLPADTSWPTCWAWLCYAWFRMGFWRHLGSLPYAGGRGKARDASQGCRSELQAPLGLREPGGSPCWSHRTPWRLRPPWCPALSMELGIRGLACAAWEGMLKM